MGFTSSENSTKKKAWKEAAESKGVALVASLDMAKAFDRVWHKALSIEASFLWVTRKIMPMGYQFSHRAQH